MYASRTLLARTTAALLGLLVTSTVQAADLRIAIRQAQEGEARKYQGLVEYLGKRGIQVSFVKIPDYRAAADMFGKGAVDAMFGGSGVACAMMIKGVAEPLVRPDFIDTPSTYSAAVIARKGSPRFDGTANWFAGKRVAFTALASGGEFFFRSLGPSKAASILFAESHGGALDALSRGLADAAVVKNHVWTRDQAKYPGFEKVGADDGVNPDGPLVVSRSLDAAVSKKLFEVLVALADDPSPEATAAKAGLRIRGYIRATPKDFRHTMKLVERAGVTRDFEYRF
jgi:ABC-type phosphate/phosphonate transport system substrate-binding protein